MDLTITALGVAAYSFVILIYVNCFSDNEEFITPNWMFTWSYVIWFFNGLFFLYNTIMESAEGATVGKMALKMVVVDRKLKRVDFLHALGRNIFKIITAVTVAGYIMLFFTRRKQALHDLITDTAVIGKDSINDDSNITKTTNNNDIDFIFDNGFPTTDANSQKRVNKSARVSASKININDCSEEQIASLPGVGPILAKKAVIIRDERGGFNSVDEFGAVLGLQRHIIERLRPMVAMSQPVRKPKPDKELNGRIIDI